MKITMRLIVVGITGLICSISAGARADDARGRPMRMLHDEHMALQPPATGASADKLTARPLPAESSGFANEEGGPGAAMLADVYRAARDGVAAEAAAERGPGPRPMPPEIKPDKLKKPR